MSITFYSFHINVRSAIILLPHKISSCSVTHEMRVIKRCNEMGLSFIVSPFEADAQMARLAQTGIVDLIITEDSAAREHIQS